MKQINITEAKLVDAFIQIDALPDMTPKNRGCLRLLTEEMFSMVKELLDTDIPSFSINYGDDKYILSLVTKTRVDETAREHFLSISSTGKNAANKGLKGMLGSIMEVMFFESDPNTFSASYLYGMHAPINDYSYQWTLSQYLQEAPQEESSSEWDGMEKSIIANFADDVSIGVRNGKLEMKVTKAF